MPKKILESFRQVLENSLFGHIRDGWKHGNGNPRGRAVAAGVAASIPLIAGYIWYRNRPKEPLQEIKSKLK